MSIDFFREEMHPIVLVNSRLDFEENLLPLHFSANSVNKLPDTRNLTGKYVFEKSSTV